MSIDLVTTLAASGTGSLAATFAAAAAGDTIVFASNLAGGSITGASTLDLNKSLTIEGHIGGGQGAPGITLNGYAHGVGPGILVEPNVVISLDGLNIANYASNGSTGTFSGVTIGSLHGGAGGVAAGGVLNEATLSISNVAFDYDDAAGGYGGGGAAGGQTYGTYAATVSTGGGPGGDAAGAIYNAPGSVLLLQAGTVTFANDEAIGGYGGPGGYGSSTFMGQSPSGAGGEGNYNAVGQPGQSATPLLDGLPVGAGGAPGQPGSPGMVFSGRDASGNATTIYTPGGGGGGGTGWDTVGGAEASVTTTALLHQVTLTGNPLGFGGATETGPFGTQALSNVGTLAFGDGTLSFDAQSGAAEVARLYGAALGRAPDAVGVGYWTDQLNHGAGIRDVAAAFTASPEFTAHYGAPTDAAFVGLLYQNVLGRAPDMVGQGYWTNQLATGHTRAEVTLGFSDSTENLANTAATTAAGVYTPDPLAVNVLRLDEALLGRGADAGGLQYWTAQQHAGASFDGVAQAFAASSEFAAHYGALADADFVAALYQNAPAAPPTPVAPHTGLASSPAAPPASRSPRPSPPPPRPPPTSPPRSPTASPSPDAAHPRV